MLNATKQITYARRTLLTLSIGVLAFSLTQKCYCTSNGACGDSIIAFLLGFFGIFGVFSGTCMGGICWLANPALFVSWFLLKKYPRYSLYTSMLATGFSFLFFFIGGEYSFETGQCNDVVIFRLGYWLWLFSAVIMLVGNVVLMQANKPPSGKNTA